MAKRRLSKKRSSLGKINIIFMALAILFLVVGYIIVNSAPNFGTILLVVGYLVLIPLALLLKTE